MRFLSSLIFGLLLLVGSSSVASAQDCPATPSGVVAVTATSPICFTASPLHNAVDVDHPVVSGYSVALCPAGSDPATCVTTTPVSIGNPTPTSANKIIVALPVTPPVGQNYFAVIFVNGQAAPGGVRYTTVSNPFGTSSNQAPTQGVGPVVVTP